MRPSIRLILESDFATAEHILQTAFGITESRMQDIRQYHALQKDSYFLASIDGWPAGMAGAIHYGSFAFVGMMAVEPPFQRQGIGYALMEHLLHGIAEWQVPLTLLDASAAGAGLYPRFGFKVHDGVGLFEPAGKIEVPSVPEQVQPLDQQDASALAEFDRPVFGGDRSSVLRLFLDDYPGRAFGLKDWSGKLRGYIFAQNSRIGPWLAFNSEDAEALLLAALSLPFEKGPVVISPQQNRIAEALLQRRGFVPKLYNQHMYRGPLPLPMQRLRIFGQASFGLG